MLDSAGKFMLQLVFGLAELLRFELSFGDLIDLHGEIGLLTNDSLHA